VDRLSGFAGLGCAAPCLLAVQARLAPLIGPRIRSGVSLCGWAASVAGQPATRLLAGPRTLIEPLRSDLSPGLGGGKRVTVAMDDRNLAAGQAQCSACCIGVMHPFLFARRS